MSRQPHLHPRPRRPARTRADSPPPRTTRAAFTLIEVILAISIAVGLLIVAVWFYRQATVYRNQLLVQADELAAIRLVTDQIAADLRAAHDDGRHAFTGDSNSVQFPKTAALPAPAARQPTGLAALTDLRLVSYRAISAMDGTNLVVRGVTRTEEALVDTLSPSSQSASSAAAPVATAVAPWAGDYTNRVETPDIEAIHHLAFRYWDGSAWKESWNSFTPPAGVEVTLASEPIPFESGLTSIATASASGSTAATAETPVERFRRVIDVPAGMASLRSRRTSPSTESRDAGGERTGP